MAARSSLSVPARLAGRLRRGGARLLFKRLEALGYRVVPEAYIAFDPLELSQYHRGDDDAFLQLYERADALANPSGPRRPTGVFTKQRRFFIVRQMAEHVLEKGVPGDFAECGCNWGHSTYIIADALAGSGRQLWVFDSFEGGLSDKVGEDRRDRGDTDEASTRRQQERFSSDLQTVQQLFADQSFVHLNKGWIPEVLSEEFRDKTYAFVHIDVDLYEPTRASLEFFFPRLSPGGVVIVDDYGSAIYPGAQQAVDEFVADSEVTLFLVNHLKGCLIVK